MPAEMYDYCLRWLVPSSSSANVSYLTDLGSYGGRGECNCRHWVTTVGPKVKKGNNVQCKHLRIAREKFTEWAILKFAEKDPNRQHDKQQLES